MCAGHLFQVRLIEKQQVDSRLGGCGMHLELTLAANGCNNGVQMFVRERRERIVQIKHLNRTFFRRFSRHLSRFQAMFVVQSSNSAQVNRLLKALLMQFSLSLSTMVNFFSLPVASKSS